LSPAAAAASLLRLPSALSPKQRMSLITSRRQTELDAAVKEIGENVTGVQSDVSNLADLDRLFATIEQEQGHLDVVFANAGSGEFAPFGAITEEHFDKMFNTNVMRLVMG